MACGFRSLWRPGLIRLMAGLGCLVFCAQVAGVAPKQDLEQSSEQLEYLRQRIGDLQISLRSAEEERDLMSDQLRDTEQRIGELTLALRRIDGKLEEHQTQLDALEIEKKERQAEFEQERQALMRQVRAAFMIGRQERLRLMLNQQDPMTLSRVVTYYDYLNRARVRGMEAIGKSVQRLTELEGQITLESQRLLQLKERRELDRINLLAAQRDRENVIVSLSADIGRAGRQLEALRNDEQRLEDLITGLRAALADIQIDAVEQTPFASTKGKLPWPVSGRLIARYGSRRKIGSLRWDGVLIAAAEGSEVQSVHRGRVAFADWLRGFGLLLIVDHGDGYMTLYGHNQSLFKETGDWVSASETIALAGKSGGRVNPAVYFGIRYEGKPVNPTAWCTRIKGDRVKTAFFFDKGDSRPLDGWISEANRPETNL